MRLIKLSRKKFPGKTSLAKTLPAKTLPEKTLIGKICILVTVTSLLTACVVAGDGVVTAVESFYVSSKKEVLVISGNTAAHPLFGSFTIDVPVVLEKKYEGEDGATLIFRTRNEKMNATIESGQIKAVFEFMNYGGVEKATVFGVYW